MKVFKYIFFFAILLFAEKGAYAQSVEYTVKASFIEKITRFTDWKYGIGSEYFVINVLGDSPFKGELERMAQKTTLKGRKIRIDYIKSVDEMKECHLLFICSSEKGKLAEILQKMPSTGILTMSDSPNFCKRGVQVNFYIDDSETVKFEMNPAAINAAGLLVDLQLLSMGKIINKN